MKDSLSLSWDAHQKNICNGLSLLQQKGEFVDMTLAADGHHVKVHQMVMSLASPYIKALISSAQCPHPVIFLNNISDATLISILEYIYTGEVQITRDGFSDFIAAGKALHIKGLRDMDESVVVAPEYIESIPSNNTPNVDDRFSFDSEQKTKEQMCKVFVDSNDAEVNYDIQHDSVDMLNVSDKDSDNELDSTSLHSDKTKNGKEYCPPSEVNYSVSNHGNLQVLVNRYIYNLKYVQKSLTKYWRCIDYAGIKCPASIYTTDDDVVLKRKCKHNHAMHDSKIMKKHKMELIFKRFNEAKDKAEQKKAGEHIEIETKSLKKES